MADTTALKNRIRAAIKANDNQEITGPVLQQSLLDMVDELNGATETEASQRQNGDSTLQQGINTERQQRQDANNALSQMIGQEAEAREAAFDDLELLDSTGSSAQNDELSISLNKNDGTPEDPEIRHISTITIPKASKTKAGLFSTRDRGAFITLNPIWIDNAYIDKTNGAVVSYPLGGFSASELIPYYSRFNYTFSGKTSGGSATCTLAFYDSSKQFISCIVGSGGNWNNYSTEIPSGTAYMRLCKDTGDLYINVDNAAYVFAGIIQNINNRYDSKLESLKEETEAIANYDKTYLKIAKVGELWNSSRCLDQGNYTLNGVYFDATRKFKKLICSCGITNDLDIKIVNLNTVQVIETIRKSGTAGVDIIVVPEDFQFDFDNNTTKIGIFIENAVLGTSNANRVVPFKSSETEDLLAFTDGSTTLLTRPYKPAMQFEIEQPLAIIREIENLKGGSSSDTDLQTYINTNRDVKLQAGTYYIDNAITIPSGTKITGVRGSTIIKLRNATHCINIGSQYDITIENITFEGTSAITPASITLSDVKNRVGEGTEVGIYVSGGPKSIFINNCRFKNFDLAGIQIYRASGDLTECCKITDCVFVNNWYGLLSDVRSEYHTVVGCSFNTNEIGCYIAGGNNYMSCCHFDKNAVGCVVSGTLGDNDSHGSIGTSSFNHNTVYSLCCIDVNNGFVFTGFGIFDGNVAIENSKKLLFDSGVIAAAIEYTNAPASQICMISNCLFHKTYGGGTISDTTRLLLKNNHFADGTDSSSINN